MEEKKKCSSYTLLTHAKQNGSDLKEHSTTHFFLNTKGSSYITVQGSHKEIYIYGVSNDL